MKKYNLGWTEISSKTNLYSSNEREDAFFELYSGYGWVLHEEEDFIPNYSLIRINPNNYGSLENSIRESLFLFDKIVIEFDNFKFDKVYNDYTESYDKETQIIEDSNFRNLQYIEKDICLQSSFLSTATLKKLSKEFGDAIENREILLLPSFDVSSNHWYGMDAVNHYDYADMTKPIWYVKNRLSKCHKINRMPSIETYPTNMLTNYLKISGGKTSDLIKLRRDEYDSFLKWKNYLNMVINSENKTVIEITEAINQGLSEYGERMLVLKRKGIFDALGAVLVTTGSIIAFILEGQVFSVGTGLLTAPSAISAIKAVYEYYAGKQEINRGIDKESYKFLWLLNQK